MPTITTVQPPQTLDAQQREVLARAVAQWSAEPGGLLPLLHQVQHDLGYLPPAMLPRIASALGLSRAEVHGVVSYYHHFRTTPPARHQVQLCRAESCQAMGADALAEHVMAATGCSGDALHACRSADGAFEVEPVYCLGLCAASPALSLDGQLHARMTAAQFDALLRQLETR